jgi:putative phage-type endonuclease
MNMVDLKQGSDAWKAHRKSHFNASDCAAMLGCSLYGVTRTDLLRQMHTGLEKEVDRPTQIRFDNGHRVEALARPLAEEFIGSDLYPVTCTLGRLSASLDGITLEEDEIFEHKALSSELKKFFQSGQPMSQLHKHYRAQLEHQLLVSGAKRALFMSSHWDGEELIEEFHEWYYPDPALRTEIVAGWKQFEADLATYQEPPASAPAPVAASVQALPAVSVVVDGSILIRENFDAFEAAAREFLKNRLIREPKTDQDFADLEVQIKAMKGAEAALDSAEEGWIAQIEPVSRAKRRKDMLRSLVRDNRLMAEKLLATEKERRRGEIVTGAAAALKKHVDGLNQRLGKPYMPAVPADFASAIRGLKSLTSMENAVATELARAKIAASETADRIQANLVTLRELATEHAFLFADTAALVLKAPDDCRAVVTSRIGEHRAAEERRLEAERQRIRSEEEARAQRQQQEREALERRQREEQEAQARQAAQAAAPALPPAAAPIAPPALVQPVHNVVPMPTKAPSGPPTLRLGVINERLRLCKVSADDLAALGFTAAGRQGASVLFHEHQFPAIVAALIAHLTGIQNGEQAAA